MKYDLKTQAKVDEAAEYLAKLAGWEAEVEIKRIFPDRTLAQNNYLHLLLTAFGMHFGYDIDEAKWLYKDVNRSIYRYERKGHVFWRSSADLNKDEMSATISKFKEMAEKQGCQLPDAEQHVWLREISNEAERTQYVKR